MKTSFYAKMWFYYVAAFVVSFLSLFCPVLGPFFLFGVMKRVAKRGQNDFSR